MNEAKIARIQQQNAKDEAWSKYYGILAHNLEEGWPLEKAKKEAEIALKKEQTRLTSIKADQGGFAPKKGSSGGRARSGKSGGKYWVDDEDGVRHYYDHKTMFEVGARQYGANLPQTYTTESTSSSGDKRTTTHPSSATSLAAGLARNADRKRKSKGKKINW